MIEFSLWEILEIALYAMVAIVSITLAVRLIRLEAVWCGTTCVKETQLIDGPLNDDTILSVDIFRELDMHYGHGEYPEEDMQWFAENNYLEGVTWGKLRREQPYYAIILMRCVPRFPVGLHASNGLSSPEELES